MKIFAVAGLVLAGSLAFAPAAFAQDAPPAAVKDAICSNATLEAISADEDVTVARLARNLKAAEDVLPAVRLEQDRRAAVAAAAKTAFNASVAPGSPASLEERNRLKAALDAANKANEEGNAARAEADQKVADLKAQLAAAQVDQRNAVELERRVAGFVGTRSFAAVKTELCTPPATTPPATTTVTPPPTVAPGAPRFATCADASAAGVHDIPVTSADYRADLDSDSDGLACELPTAGLDGGDQVSVVPNAIDTGRA